MLNNQRVFAGSIHLLFLSCFELWKNMIKHGGMNAIWYTLKWWMMKNRGPPLTVWSQGSELVFISQIRLWPSSIFPFARIVLIHKNTCWYLVYILVQLLLFSSQSYSFWHLLAEVLRFFLALQPMNWTRPVKNAEPRWGYPRIKYMLPSLGGLTAKVRKKDLGNWEKRLGNWEKLWLFDGLELFYFMTFHSVGKKNPNWLIFFTGWNHQPEWSLGELMTSTSDPSTVAATRAWKTLQWANLDKKRAQMPVSMRWNGCANKRHRGDGGLGDFVKLFQESKTNHSLGWWLIWYDWSFN